MTAPASGRADFQTTAQWFTPAASYASHAYPGTDTVIESRNVANWLAYKITVSCTAGAGIINVDLWTDATQTVNIRNYQYVVGSGTFVEVTVPIDGPYLTLSIDATDSGGATLSAITSLGNVPVPRPAFPNVTSFDSTNFATAPASQTVTFKLVDVVPGEAYVYFNDESFSGKLTFTLEGYDDNNALSFRVIMARLITGPFFARIITPPVPLAVRVQNTDTVSHQYSWYVARDGMQG